VSVHLRHADVHERHFGPEFLAEDQGFLTVVSHADRVAAGLEEKRHALGRVLVVVHDQDPPRSDPFGLQGLGRRG